MVGRFATGGENKKASFIELAFFTSAWPDNVAPRPAKPQLCPTWRMFEMLSPEEKQPTRRPLWLVSGGFAAWSHIESWLVTALLHEALHLPIVRTPHTRWCRGFECCIKPPIRPAHGLAVVPMDEIFATSMKRKGLDRIARLLSQNRNDAPSGSPIHCCHASFQANGRPISNRFREAKGIDPYVSL